MRIAWVFVVGFAALGCKDKAQPSSASGAPAARAPQSTPDRPSLAPGDPTKPAVPDEPTAVAAHDFEAEAEDPAWAAATEKSIRAVAPELTDVECHEQQCRATVTATSEDELVQKVERLQREEVLPSTKSTGVLHTAPTSADGKLSMKIYVRYER